MTLSRQLEQALRQSADQQSDQVAAIPADKLLILTVTAVTEGASPKGNAVLEVDWGGADVPVTDYAAAYTPGVGDRVVCVHIDNQLIVLDVLAG